MFGRAEMIIKVARRCFTLSLSLYETVNHWLIMTCSIVLLVSYILSEFKLCLIYQLNNQILSWICPQSKTGDYEIHVVNLLCHATVIQSTLLCILSTSFCFFGATTEYRAIFQGLKQKWLGGSLVMTSV